jgi:hypothetical protein
MKFQYRPGTNLQCCSLEKLLPLATNPAYFLFYPCVGKSLADTPFTVALCGTMDEELKGIIHRGRGPSYAARSQPQYNSAFATRVL